MKNKLLQITILLIIIIFSTSFLVGCAQEIPESETEVSLQETEQKAPEKITEEEDEIIPREKTDEVQPEPEKKEVKAVEPTEAVQPGESDWIYSEEVKKGLPAQAGGDIEESPDFLLESKEPKIIPEEISEEEVINIAVEPNTIFKTRCGGISFVVNKSGLLVTNKACSDIWNHPADLGQDKPINTIYLSPLVKYDEDVSESYRGVATQFQIAAQTGLYYRIDGQPTYLDSSSSDGFPTNISIYYLSGKKLYNKYQTEYLWTDITSDIVKRTFAKALMSMAWPKENQEVYILSFEFNKPVAAKTFITEVTGDYIHTDKKVKNGILLDAEQGKIIGFSSTVASDKYLKIERLREKMVEKGFAFND